MPPFFCRWVRETLFIVVAIVGVHESLAATTAEYTGKCRFIDQTKSVSYFGPCNINFGIAGMASAYGARYILSAPGRKEITIYVFQNDLAIIDDLPARTMPSPPKIIRYLTGAGQEVQFSAPPAGST